MSSVLSYQIFIYRSERERERGGETLEAYCSKEPSRIRQDMDFKFSSVSNEFLCESIVLVKMAIRKERQVKLSLCNYPFLNTFTFSFLSQNM